MKTDLGGFFHPEFMFCDITGIRYVKKITSDTRIDEILEADRLKQLSKKMKDDRKRQKKVNIVQMKIRHITRRYFAWKMIQFQGHYFLEEGELQEKNE